MIKVFNAFSVQMVGMDFSVKGKEISLKEAQTLVGQGVDSYVGHPDTAVVLSSMLGRTIPAERRFGSIEIGETVLVAQVTGGRLPEGVTTLPEGMKLRFCLVTRCE